MTTKHALLTATNKKLQNTLSSLGNWLKPQLSPPGVEYRNSRRFELYLSELTRSETLEVLNIYGAHGVQQHFSFAAKIKVDQYTSGRLCTHGRASTSSLTICRLLSQDLPLMMKEICGWIHVISLHCTVPHYTSLLKKKHVMSSRLAELSDLTMPAFGITGSIRPHAPEEQCVSHLGFDR